MSSPGEPMQRLPRHTLHEKHWLVHGAIRLRRARHGTHDVWYAEDDEGIVAMAESRAELERALRERGHRTDPSE